MKKNKKYIWAEFCSYLSNGKINTQSSDLANKTTESTDAKLFNMLKKDTNNIDKTAYMFDEETDQAWTQLHNKILSSERSKNPIHLFKHRPLLKIAASIILLVGISWLTYNFISQSNLYEVETLATQTIEILPDGTTVHLNANSKIEYPKKFNKRSREVILSGEAFFDVVKDPNRPFIITAENARIEVLGTSFNILTEKITDKVEVLVESGTVSLSSVKNHDKLILTKGQFGLYQNKSLIREDVGDINYLSWRTKLIEFREAPLNYVIDILNKTYTSNITIKGDVSSDFRLNAKFDKVPLDTVLESICLAFDLDHKQINGRIQIVSNNTK